MNEEEKANREYRLYEFLRRASLDDSILLRTDDWKHVEQEIHALWPDFGRKLYEYGVNLSDTERRICWMARMNIPPLGMATILKRTKPAISLAPHACTKNGMAHPAPGRCSMRSSGGYDTKTPLFYRSYPFKRHLYRTDETFFIEF